MENKFGIYSFVAYVLPGGISVLSILLIIHWWSPLEVSTLQKNQFISGIIYISAAYVIGQITASFTHRNTRPLGWIEQNFALSSLTKWVKSKLGREKLEWFKTKLGESNVKRINHLLPRTKPKEISHEGLPSFYINFATEKAHRALAVKASKILEELSDIEIDLITEFRDKKIPKDYQKILSFHMENTVLLQRAAYRRLVSSRSFTGNAAFSTLGLSLAAGLYSPFYTIFLLFLTAQLLRRQMSFDKRVWKEVYIAILAHE